MYPNRAVAHTIHCVALLLGAECIGEKAAGSIDHLVELQRVATSYQFDITHGVSEVPAYKLASDFFEQNRPEYKDHFTTASTFVGAGGRDT